MPTKSAVMLEAEKLCKDMPTANSRTLAKRIAEEFSITLEQARNHVRYARGAQGKARRSAAVAERATNSEKAKSPRKPPTQLPDSLAESWEPVIVDAGRILVLSDVHIPYHSKLAVESALDHGDSINPDTVILNGDIADFYTISRHQKDPRKRGFKTEMMATKQFLVHVRERFKGRMIYKYGNHEERWEHWVWNHAPEVADCAQMLLSTWLELENLGIEWVDNQRPIMAGALPIFHGHELPKGMTSPVNQARGAFLRMLDTVLVGHGHRSSSHTEPNWQHTETTTWSTGCLCALNPEYARINKWNHGFADVEVARDGSFSLHNLRVNKSGVVRPA